VLVLALAGCTPAPEIGGTVSQLRELPGVDSVEGSGEPGNIDNQATASVYLTPTTNVTREQIVPIVNTWSVGVAGESGYLRLTIEMPNGGDFSLSTIGNRDAVTAAEEWFDLQPQYSASTDVGFSSVSVFIQVGAVDPAAMADLVDGLPESAVATDIELRGDIVTVIDPTLASTAALRALQSPYDAALQLGEMTVESNYGRLDISLSPDSLKNTPSNELNGVFAADPMYAVALQILDAIPASEGRPISLSLFSNRAFATLSPSDCTFDGDLAVELWAYWGAC
jgi:hypothetical protein